MQAEVDGEWHAAAEYVGREGVGVVVHAGLVLWRLMSWDGEGRGIARGEQEGRVDLEV